MDKIVGEAAWLLPLCSAGASVGGRLWAFRPQGNLTKIEWYFSPAARRENPLSHLRREGFLIIIWMYTYARQKLRYTKEIIYG